MTLCCLCCVACVRCCARPGDERINYNVEAPNPNWDADQVRVYHIRRIQRSLSTMQQQDQQQQRDLEQQLKDAQAENMRQFMGSLEDIQFDPKNEFETTDCVICLDNFAPGQFIKRIPTCRHFFHPHCCNKWFESKKDDDEQRCPQCNTILKTEEMEQQKLLNLQERNSQQFISPKVKQGNHASSSAKINPGAQELSRISYGSSYPAMDDFSGINPVNAGLNTGQGMKASNKAKAKGPQARRQEESSEYGSESGEEWEVEPSRAYNQNRGRR